VEDNLSTIDYSATGDRTAAVEKCPTDCIIPADRLLKPALSDEAAPQSGKESTEGETVAVAGGTPPAAAESDSSTDPGKGGDEVG
jgi:hypothetical protein